MEVDNQILLSFDTYEYKNPNQGLKITLSTHTSMKYNSPAMVDLTIIPSENPMGLPCGIEVRGTGNHLSAAESTDMSQSNIDLQILYTEFFCNLSVHLL